MSYTIGNLVAGESYKIIVRASNIYGYSTFSDPVVLAPSGVPATMSPVTTTLEYPLVKIKFDSPPDNG